MKDIFADAEYSGDSALEKMKQKLIGEPVAQVPSQQKVPAQELPTKPYTPAQTTPTDLTAEFNRLNPQQRAQLTDGAFSDNAGNISLQSVNDPALKKFEGMKINQKQATSVPLYANTTLSAPTGKEVSRDQYRPDEQTNPVWEFVKAGAKSSIEAGRSVLGLGEMIFDERLNAAPISSLKQNIKDFLIEHPELEPSNRVPKTLSEGWKNPDYIAGALGNVIPSIVGTVGATIAGGPIAGYGFAFSQEAGSTYNDLLDSGVNKKSAAVASTLYGSVAAVLENAFPQQIASKILNPTHIVSSSLKDAAVQYAKELPKTALRSLYSAIKEGGTEATQQVAQNFTKWYFNKNQDLFEGVPESAFAGALGGAGVDVISDIFVGHDQNVDVNRPIKSNVTEEEKKQSIAHIADIKQTKESLETNIQLAEKMLERYPQNTALQEKVSKAKEALTTVGAAYSNAINEYLDVSGFKEVDTPNLQIDTAQLDGDQWVAKGKAMINGYNLDVPYSTSEIFTTPEEATNAIVSQIQNWVKTQQESPQMNDVTGLAHIQTSIDQLIARPTTEQILQNKELVLNAQDMSEAEFLTKYAKDYPLVQLKGIYDKSHDIRVKLQTKHLAEKPIRELAKNIGVSVQWVEHIATVEGRRALGSYQNQVIKLLQDKNGNPIADAATAWNELGHAYFRTVMTQDQRASVLDQVKAQHNITSDLNAEEKLVEDLKSYVDGKMDTQTKYGKFIGKLIDIVKKFTNWAKGDRVSQFYEAVLAGKKPSERKAMTDAELQDRAQQHEEKVAQLKEKVSKELEDNGIDMNQFAMHRLEDDSTFKYLIDEAQKYKNVNDFIENISDKLYALNKKAKEYRGAGVGVDESGSFYKISGTKEEALRRDLYEIKNKLIEKFGKNTGKVHQFGDEKFLGIGEEFTITGKDSFHNYFRYYDDFVEKRLKDIQKDKTVSKQLDAVKQKYGLSDISINYGDPLNSNNYKVYAVPKIKNVPYEQGFINKKYLYEHSRKEQLQKLKDMYGERYGLVAEYVQNPMYVTKYGHSLKRELNNRLNEINNYKSSATKNRYAQEKNNILEKLQFIESVERDKKFIQLQKQIQETLDKIEKYSEVQNLAKKEIEDIIKKHEKFIDRDTQFPKINTISSENKKNIQLTERDIEMLRRLAEDNNIVSMTDLKNLFSGAKSVLDNKSSNQLIDEAHLNKTTAFRLEKDIFNEYDTVKAEQIGQMIEIMNMRPMTPENAKSYENLVKYAHEFNQQLINKYAVGFPADMMNQINKASSIVDEYLGVKRSYEAQAKDKNTGISRVSERMKALYPELDDPVLYDKIKINEEVSKAVDLVEKDQIEAYRQAIGMGDTTPYQSTAANIALTEKALADGNFELANTLIKQRSKMQTSYGQSIVMEKSTITDNSSQRYLDDLITSRMANLGQTLQMTELDKKLKKTVEQKVREHIDTQVQDAKKKISKKKMFDIKQAQDFISSLACK